MTPGIFVVLNPFARGEKTGAFADEIRRLCTGAEVRLTSGPGQARALAAQAASEGYGTVVAAGGDGTINEVVNGIAGTDVALGILPAGTMNVFASELGLPTGDRRNCWEIIRAGKTRQVDLLHANGHRFVQLAGVGFDAQIVQETPWEFRKNWGPLSYLVSATQIAARRPPRLVVESGGVTREGSFVMVGNGRYYGGPFVLFTGADVADGKMDVLIFRNLGYLDILRYLQAIVFEAHTQLPDVEYFQATSVSVSSAAEVPVEVDGEVIGRVPVTFGLDPGSLRVVVETAKASNP